MALAHTIHVAEPQLFNPQSGRLDAVRIGRELNVPVATTAEAIGRKAPGVRKHPGAEFFEPAFDRREVVLDDSDTRADG
jgi:hypothetical protein